MVHFNRVVAATVIAALAASCSPGQAGRKEPQPPAAAESLASQVNSLADEYIKEFVSTFPEQASFLGLAGADAGRLSDNSPAALREWRAREDQWSKVLAAIDGRTLWGRPEWVTFGFLKEAVESSRETRVARPELMPANHMSGWQAGLAQLAGIQPVGNDAARTRALARWGSVPRYLDNEIAALRDGLKQGFTVPKLVVRLVIEQLDALAAMPPAESPFFSPAGRDGTPEFKTAWLRLMKEDIDPAVRRYRDFLKNEYLAGARESLGVSALPDGRAAWEANFRANTSIHRSPEETFRLGEETVARYESEAKAIARQLFGTDDPAVVRAKLADDPRNHFKSREEMMAFANDTIVRAKKALPDWFLTIPKAEVMVVPHPAFLEKTASHQYESAAEDGSRPGIYRINLYQPERQSRATLEITTVHETYPGHHFQISLAMERPKAHLITRLLGNGGYIEGWARYAEALAEEMGIYTTDFARISRRIWPAHGMVVDPGIHIMGWSRQKAIDYVFATGRFSPHEAASLVDRIIAWPSQLTSYDTGALEFFALRRQAEQELGKAFNIKAFHDEVLKYGSVTLPMLREIVDRWIADKRGDNAR
jgi:uncharacterized protein (DUF885 family)